jgi:hypothetical protein
VDDDHRVWGFYLGVRGKNSGMAARAGILACFLGALASCERRQPLEKLPGCRTPEIVECLQSYASGTLDSDEIRLLIEEGVPRCLAKKDPRRLAEQASCLPLEIGKDERNGLPVMLAYSCDDLCPAYGMTLVLYQGIKADEAQCCATGGYPWKRAGEGHVGRACVPPEFPPVRWTEIDADLRRVRVEAAQCGPAKRTVLGDAATPW